MGMGGMFLYLSALCCLLNLALLFLNQTFNQREKRIVLVCGALNVIHEKKKKHKKNKTQQATLYTLRVLNCTREATSLLLNYPRKVTTEGSPFSSPSDGTHYVPGCGLAYCFHSVLPPCVLFFPTLANRCS